MGSSTPFRHTGPGDGRRALIVRFIREFGHREGYSPCLREIAGGVGLAASTVSYHLAALERDGAPAPRCEIAAHDRASRDWAHYITARATMSPAEASAE
jgi:SOS-response transcriptional repressor LexA